MENGRGTINPCRLRNRRKTKMGKIKLNFFAKRMWDGNASVGGKSLDFPTRLFSSHATSTQPRKNVLIACDYRPNKTHFCLGAWRDVGNAFAGLRGVAPTRFLVTSCRAARSDIKNDNPRSAKQYARKGTKLCGLKTKLPPQSARCNVRVNQRSRKVKKFFYPSCPLSSR